MSDGDFMKIAVAVFTVVIIPWVVFVTVTLFNHKQEIALIKQTHSDIRDFMATLVRQLSKVPRAKAEK